jgi:hypothetical protein
MSEEEKKQIKEDIDAGSSNNISDSKKDNIEYMDDELEKEDSNFDSIDFNMNPFNNNNEITNGERHKESDDFILSKKEDKNIQINNDLNDNLNFKLNIYPDTMNNQMMNSNPENISINTNIDYNNIFNNFNNNNTNDNNNFINYINGQEKNVFKNNFNKPIGFNNNVINNNVFNIGYDIKAAPFLPKSSNIQMNPNMNNININNNNNNSNNLLFSKGFQSWICPYCHNYNSKGKHYIFIIVFFNL